MPIPSDPVDDDLTRVCGIEPGIADRLRHAGIHTVVELSRATVEQVVGAFGSGRLATTRARGWIDQAADLVDRVPRSGAVPASGLSPSDAWLLPRRTFTVEVWVDAHAEQVVATRLIHLETQHADAWSGWSRSRLLDFIEERMGVREPERGPAGGSATRRPGSGVVDAAAQAPDALTPVPEAPLSHPALVVHRFGLLKAAARVMGRGEAAARLRLDADDLDLPPGLTSVAQIELLAQPLGAGRAEVVDARAIELAPGRTVDTILRGRLPGHEPPFAVLAVVRVLVDQPSGNPTEDLGGASLELVPTDGNPA